MIGSDERGGGSSGRWLAAGALAALAWVAWGLVRHPGFQPVQVLRTAAPVIALLVGGGFTRAVALVRARADAEREFDRGGKALFMGFVMVAGTFVGWLLVSQAIPSTWTALAGAAGTRPGVVVERPAQTADTDCPDRLVVAGTEPGNPGVPTGAALDECVDAAVWRGSDVHRPVALHEIRSVLGAELVGVSTAP
jgi:hypothetical protein